MAFTHLHLHTEYSLLDGACRLGELCAVAKDLGQTALAITDHGNMFGAVDFYKTAKANGIKPIIGCEVYVAERNLTDKVHGLDSQRYHLVLLCKNETGYKNLIQMVSKSWVDGFYVRPRVDKALLEEYHEGLIALSACLAGEIPRKLSVKDFEGAKETALWYNRVFGAGNYYSLKFSARTISFWNCRITDCESKRKFCPICSVSPVKRGYRLWQPMMYTTFKKRTPKFKKS